MLAVIRNEGVCEWLKRLPDRKVQRKKEEKKNIPYMKLRQHLRLVINICKANLLFKNNFKALI